MILDLTREYFELIKGCATKVKDENSFIAVHPDGAQSIVRILLSEPKSDEIEKAWINEHMEKEIRKIACCPPPYVEYKDIREVKEKIRKTVRKGGIDVIFLDEMIQELIDYCSERTVPWSAKFTKLIGLIESFYNAEPRSLIRLERREKIEYGFDEAEEIYEKAIKLHGREEMENYLTTVYYLDSIESIREVMDSGGEYITLKRDGRIIGMACYKRGISFRKLENPEEIVKLKEDFIIAALLVAREERGKGYGWKLFLSVLKRLRMKGAKRAIVPITGCFNRKKLGKVREMSKKVETFCKKLEGKLIGYTINSFGPVYEISLGKAKETLKSPFL